MLGRHFWFCCWDAILGFVVGKDYGRVSRHRGAGVVVIRAPIAIYGHGWFKLLLLLLVVRGRKRTRLSRPVFAIRESHANGSFTYHECLIKMEIDWFNRRLRVTIALKFVRSVLKGLMTISFLLVKLESASKCITAPLWIVDF